MYSEYFLQQEDTREGQQIPLQAFIGQLNFNDQGLIAVITQCVHSREILMQAWMNPESLELTLSSGQVTYWSRSRQKLWRKGESSGHVQTLHELRIDCDGDSLLALVDQNGAACHTGRQSCFYFSVAPGADQVRVLNSRPD